MFKSKKSNSKVHIQNKSEEEVKLFSDSTYNEKDNLIDKPKKKQKNLLSAEKKEIKHKKKSEHKVIYYFNHKHLKEAVSGYGYMITSTTLLQYYSYALIIGFFISRLYKLPIWASLVTMVIAVIVAIRLILNKYYNLYQVRRFNDANRYIEKMISSFKQTHLIYESLKNVYDIFSDGEMKTAIKKAKDVLENTEIISDANDDSTIMKNTKLKEMALSYISEAYNCRRINMLHKFLIIVEKTGGDCNPFLDMLLKDRNLWETRCQDAQISRRHNRTTFFISVIIASVLCAVPFYMPALLGDTFKIANIADYPPIAIGSLIYIIITALFLNSSDKAMCSNWLNDVDDVDLEKAEKDYYSFIEFDPHKGTALSLVIASLVATLVIIQYVFIRNIFLLLAGMFLVLHLLRLHESMHKSLYKSLKKRIEIAVPYWIMNVALLLQSKSVRAAISASYDDAPNILKPALKELKLGLDELPEDYASYDLFLKEFGLTEVEECMQTLYTLSMGKSKDDINFLTDIIDKSTVLMDRSEEIKIQDRSAVLGVSVMVPVLFSSIKLMIDLSVFSISFMFNLSNSLP